MRCERLIAFLFLLAACARETPAPPPEPAAEPPRPTLQQTPLPRSYDDAMTWFRSTPGFDFVVEENGVRGEGTMERPTVGAERVGVTANGETWTAEAGRTGVVWRRDGAEAPAPPWGNRLYQRVTVAFDPEKSEGAAQQLEPGHYRFTDANSGAVHDVWVNAAGQIERVTIGDSFSMTLTRQK